MITAQIDEEVSDAGRYEGFKKSSCCCIIGHD